MKLIEQWRAYVGPVDERVEAESNRIYKVGFIMLTFGLLVALGYDTMVRQIVWMHEIDMTGSGVMQFDMFHVMVVSWLLLTCLACAVLQSRKGFADDGNRFSETDRFPGGYFALVSGLAAVVAGVLIALLRVLAELQVLGSVGASAWFAAAVLGLSIAALLFVVLVVAFYVSFRAAKSRRRAIGALLDD